MNLSEEELCLSYLFRETNDEYVKLVTQVQNKSEWYSIPGDEYHEFLDYITDHVNTLIDTMKYYIRTMCEEDTEVNHDIDLYDGSLQVNVSIKRAITFIHKLQNACTFPYPYHEKGMTFHEYEDYLKKYTEIIKGIIDIISEYK